jgi:hypothetical protein
MLPISRSIRIPPLRRPGVNLWRSRGGPEELTDAATRLIRSRGDRLGIEVADNRADPDRELYESGAALPGPDATLAGPTLSQRPSGEPEAR